MNPLTVTWQADIISRIIILVQKLPLQPVILIHGLGFALRPKFFEAPCIPCGLVNTTGFGSWKICRRCEKLPKTWRTLTLTLRTVIDDRAWYTGRYENSRVINSNETGRSYSCNVVMSLEFHWTPYLLTSCNPAISNSWFMTSFKNLLLSIGLSRPLAPITNAPWFSSETLALYKSLTYLLTWLLTYISLLASLQSAEHLPAYWIYQRRRRRRFRIDQGPMRRRSSFLWHFEREFNPVKL